MPQSDPKAEAGSPLGLSGPGRVRVLRLLTERRRLSRSEIAARTGLARATVGAIVCELIDRDLVRESATIDADGIRAGRPAQILSLVPDCAYALGLDIASDHVRAVMTDVVGTVLWDRTRPMAVDNDPEQTLDTAARLIDSALADVGVPRGSRRAGAACNLSKDWPHAPGYPSRSSTTPTPASWPSDASAPIRGSCTASRSTFVPRPRGDGAICASRPAPGPQSPRLTPYWSRPRTPKCIATIPVVKPLPINETTISSIPDVRRAPLAISVWALA